ncbi:helix-turn-helix domain-containing protein [Polaribacter porphyrae]|uniref:HTH araC/xylS-type domain-containing protein n=1 Tax=Polaribacter porphyrae TaxID=1137780 RepID=A0A2S7WLN9_9FLAO|nr:AraC family transcriptional regulator [Polaribacter porphyrae]PQJ78518.1 hypothetical protein BTO18_04650 [Polaribacter porphyrae]
MKSEEKTFYETKLVEVKNTCFSNDKQIEVIIETKRLIDNNSEKELSLDVISKIQFTSKYHLLRLFKRYYGQTPRQYLIDKRIEKSKQKLANGKGVSETCFEVGFESLGSFSKLLKKKQGNYLVNFKKSNFREVNNI